MPFFINIFLFLFLSSPSLVPALYSFLLIICYGYNIQWNSFNNENEQSTKVSLFVVLFQSSSNFPMNRKHRIMNEFTKQRIQFEISQLNITTNELAFEIAKKIEFKWITLANWNATNNFGRFSPLPQNEFALDSPRPGSTRGMYAARK